VIIPRQVYLASQALPAAGAFVVGGTFNLPAGATQLTWYCTYTRGAVNGQPVFQFSIGNGTELCRTTVVDNSSLVIAAPNATYNIYEERVKGPVVGSASPICYIIRLCLNQGETTVRMSVAEIGVVGTPGTIAVALTGGGSSS
jgi:hypothetical protein